MRKLITMFAAVTVAAGLVLTAPGTANASPYCGIHRGSLPKSVSGHVTPWWPIENVRAGRHGCFDRLVIDFDGPPSAYRVRYVPTVTQPGSGAELPLRGGASLRIDVKSATYDIYAGSPTYRPANPDELVDVHNWQTFRQIALGGSFEGSTTIGLGVRARLPFRVFTLTDPGRVVIDVAHYW